MTMENKGSWSIFQMPFTKKKNLKYFKVQTVAIRQQHIKVFFLGPLQIEVHNEIKVISLKEISQFVKKLCWHKFIISVHYF